MEHACIDHGIDGCEDCGHWQDAADQREDEHERQIAALTADLRIARHDLSVAVAERDALQARIDAALKATILLGSQGPGGRWNGQHVTDNHGREWKHWETRATEVFAILSGEDVE